MAYTSIIPVSRLDNSITYIRNKDKTTKKGQSAGSLEEAIDYAMNRDKTERSIFEDAIGCVCETAYQDMVATKKRYHKMDGVQGFHLVQSFAKGEVTPELAHRIGMELAKRLLQGKYEAVITTHLNTEHYHNHIVFNSVSMEDGKKYHSNSRSYYEDVRKASDALCLKYGLSVIEPKNGKGKSYAQWMAEQDGKPTWRTSIRLDIRDAVAESFTWKQFLEQMKQRGYQWKLNRKYIALKAPGMERYIRLRSLGKHYSEESMQRMHIPEAFIIPFSVMFRFFPTISEEAGSIGNAMRMRGITGKNFFKNPQAVLEYRIVPLMMSVVTIGNDLSAAALTRGLGNGKKRTSICKIGFHWKDFALMIIVTAALLVFLLF